MKDVFSTYHPVINFLFFCAVICFSMFLLHPVFLGISAGAAFLYSILLSGRRALRFNLIFVLPSLILVSLINPLFNHEGVTILWYFRNNPITLESILYGLATGMMFASIILWFSCYNAVMTSDKFIYLFGRVIPALSLIFSMVLRFVPRFKAQIKIVSNAQKCVGRDVSNGSLRERAKYGLKILSAMVTWALENSIDTADSMRSRGYGLKGRTSFSIFRFDGRDKGLLLFMGAAVLVILTAAFSGQVMMQYFPYIKIAEISAPGAAAYAAYALLCFSPVILYLKEEMQWRRLQSKT